MEIVKAVYAGSFDPITNGHIHIIKKALKIFDKVVVLVANNPSKKSMFSLHERVALCSEALKECNISASVGSCNNEFVADYIKRIDDARFLVRGIRSVNDFQGEFDIYHTNQKVSHNLETVFLMPDIDLSPLRSSVICGVVGLNDWWWHISDSVPSCVLREFARRCARKAWRGVFGRGMTLSNDFVHCDKEYERKYHNWLHIFIWH